MDLCWNPPSSPPAGSVDVDAEVEEADGERGSCFEVGDGSEETFPQLLARLPEAERHPSDAYGMYGFLPRDRHIVGKGSEVNRNEGRTPSCGTI